MFCISINIKMYNYLVKLSESKSSLGKINIHVTNTLWNSFPQGGSVDHRLRWL